MELILTIGNPQGLFDILLGFSLGWVAFYLIPKMFKIYREIWSRERKVSK